jgi:acyl-phosphate glycerol 3-phosphate acyltransferase
MSVQTLALIAILLVGAYLLGAVPFGYVLARWHGIDIFQHGSGNIGATNVGRVLGKRYGILVFVLDFAKGAIPTALAARFGPQADLPPGLLPVAAGLAAFLGHLFPVYLGFRGGKGVATGAGVVAVLLPWAAAAAFLTWLTLVAWTRYISLASVVAGGALCVFRVFGLPEPFAVEHRILTVFCFVAAGLVLVRHKSNVSRLLQGTESRLPDSPTMRQLTKVLHIVAVGLAFGSGVFFSFVVALSLFHTFEGLGSLPPAERPAWLPVSADFDKEKGTRLAGFAVGPLFVPYFLLQGTCALIALATSLTWSRAEPTVRVHRLRFSVLTLALITILAGWPLLIRVSELRVLRYHPEPAVAEAARAAFGTWHTISLLLNLVTVLLVAGAMILVAWLPPAGPEQKAASAVQ